LVIKSQSIKLNPKEQTTGIIIKINVPTRAGKINTQPVKDWLLNSFDNNFSIFIVYYESEE